VYNEDKKVVAIYTRVSTLDQAREGHSLEEQERRLRALCETYDYKIYKVYTDAGISGKSAENRPQYQQMLKDMRKRKFNVIMAFKLDRISRSIVDFEELFMELKKYNCGIELLHEKIDTNLATGMMFARILGAFAQFEREIIQERTLIGVESAVDKGHFGGRAPLGYKHKLDANGKEKLKEWEINEEEAKIVKEIYDLCSNGKTYLQISKILKKKYPKVISRYILNKETNEKEPIYRTWSDGSISTILNNKCYIGIYEHRKTIVNKDTRIVEDKVPPIISEDLFYDCQDMIIKNGRNYYRSKNYLFMQKIKCPKCGRIMKCNGTKKPNGKEYLYYKCKDCGIYIREEIIENVLISKLNQLLELSNIINDSHMIVDSYIAEKFNSCKLNHKLRFAIDESIIGEKRKAIDTINLNEVWNMTSYEAKCKFILSYVDTITISEYKRKGKKIEDAKIIDLKLKPHKINKLLDYENKNMIDTVIGKGLLKTSITNVKNEKDAFDYIEILKMKYNFEIIEWEDDEDWFLFPTLFKIIKINPTSAAKKKRILGLYLKEKTATLFDPSQLSYYPK